MTVTLGARVYLTAEGRATTDPETAASLLGIAGDEIATEVAERHGVNAVTGLPEDEGGTVEEMDYRDLQAKAKDLGIPANQSREALTEAIEEAQAAQTQPPSNPDTNGGTDAGVTFSQSSGEAAGDGSTPDNVVSLPVAPGDAAPSDTNPDD